MTITAGSYTVGTGGTYATWKAATIDIRTLTGNITLTQISDINSPNTETAVFIAGVGLSTFTLLLTTDTPHNGDPTKGWKTTIANTSTDAFILEPTISSPSGTIEFSGLRFARTAAGNATSRSTIAFTSTTSAYTFKCHDCIFDDNYRGVGGSNNIIRSGAANAGLVVFIYNCYFYDTPSRWISFQTGNIGSGSIVENCTGYLASSGQANVQGFRASQTGSFIFRNCAGFKIDGGTGTCFSVAGGGATVVNCAASDASGSTGFQNLTIAQHIQSTDVTKANFFDIALPGSGSFTGFYYGYLWQQNGNQSLISGHTKDIRGRNIPNNRGLFSIGACTAWNNQAVITQ